MLVKDLLERFQSAMETGDPAPVMDTVAARLARDVAGLLGSGLRKGAAADVDVMGLLVAVHWTRYQVLPEGQDQDDLAACVAWSAVLLPAAPDLVPEPVRDHLTGGEAHAWTSGDSAAETNNRAIAQIGEYQETGNIDHLHAAVTLFQEALEATTPDHPNQAPLLYNLGKALRTRFGRTGQQQDLDQAITVTGEAVQATPHDHPDRARYLSTLGITLQTRFERTGQQQDLDQAITIGREAVEATPPDHPDRALRLSNLGVALQTRFERTGQQQDLDQAITAGREAVQATPSGHPDRAAMLSNLGIALLARFGRTGQQQDLDQAITIGREAVETAPPDHPDRTMSLSNLGIALRTRFERTGQQQDLDQAITIGREAVEATPPDHSDRAGCLSNLGVALRVRFERTGQQQDLDQAITAGWEAVEATPSGHPDRAAMLSNLGIALLARFGRTGQQQDLDQAITIGREAVEATSPDHPNRAGYLSNLGAALATRFGRTGQQQDLDQAITVTGEAVKATSPDHPDRARYLSNLGAALQTRFGRTGQQQDLDQAITVTGEAVKATSPDHPDRARYLSNLGIALQTRFERTAQQQDLDQAITIGREAVEATPPDRSDRARYLSNLGNMLAARFERTGQQQDLDQAITIGREAVEATPPDHPDRAGRLSNLGNALQTRFGQTQQQQHLDQAITVTGEAIQATPPDHPNRAMYLSNLGNALQARFGRTGQQQDLDQAVGVYREGSGVVTASPGVRLTAARAWGRCLVLAGRGPTAVQAYEAAVALLPLVVWHGLDRQTREHHLRESAGLASEAAAAAIAAGDPRRAVELTEAARTLLWTQALHLRQDLTALQQRAPELAATLERARTVLDRAPGPADHPTPAILGDQDRDQVAEQQMLQARRRAARDWDTAVEQIRRLDGLQHFLKPVPFTALHPAAADGPVVIMNVSPSGSHALIITSPHEDDPGTDTGVQVLDLPAAPWGTVIDQAVTLLGAQSRAGDPDTDPVTRENDRHTVFDVLAWTWQAITEPVLTALGHTTTPTGQLQDWPRIWWCPTGPTTVLPLHATGIHPRTDIQYTAIGASAATAPTVAGRVISSYTPTLTALIRARTRPTPGPPRTLAVGVPDAPAYVTGAGPLPAVLPELQAVADHLPPPDQATHLVGPTASRDQVLHRLTEHSWLHLSCHGIQHPADASLSAFMLHDQPLTLGDLAALDLPDAELAYLAACQTATGDVRLLDEALHLAGAMQLVGYRHVLATLWSISDAAAPAMADAIYAHLTHPDPDHPTPADHPDAARAAYALHHAVTRLRQACPSEPLTWAPYIHLGP